MVLLYALARGLMLGMVAGVPAGPASAAVANASIRHSLAKGLSAALGGALVDFGYAMAAATGATVLLHRFPGILEICTVVGGLGLIVFGVVSLFRAKAQILVKKEEGPQRTRKRSLLSGFGTGLLVTLANPGLALAWVVMAGAFLRELSLPELLAAGCGIFLAAFSCFSAVAWFAHRGGKALGERVVWLSRGVAVLLTIYGVVLVGRVGIAWASGTSLIP